MTAAVGRAALTLTRRSTRRRRGLLATVLLPIAVAIGVCLIWQAYVVLAHVSPITLPGPVAVAQGLVANAPLLAAATAVTVEEILLGFALAIVVGLAVAAAIHSSTHVERAVVPWMVASQMIPIPAIAPLLVLWTGFDIRPVLLLIALVCFFPITVNAVDGLRSADPALLDLLRTMRASRLQRLRLAQLPAALPLIFSGLRIAAAFAVLGAVFGEWVGAKAGLGHLILVFNGQLDTASMLGAVVVLSALGVALFGAVTGIERLVIPWYAAQRRGR